MDFLKQTTIKNSIDICVESYLPTRKSFTELMDSTDVLTIGHKLIGGDFYFCFQGSQEKSDWFRNLDFTKFDLDDDAEVHEGFFEHLNKFRNQLIKLFIEHYVNSLEQNKNIRVIICGHSLGGALATLFAYEIVAKQFPHLTKIVTVVTLGSPRVGNYSFMKKFNKLIACYRLVNGGDIVARIPKLLYWHVGELIHLGRRKFFASIFDHSPILYKIKFDQENKRRLP